MTMHDDAFDELASAYLDNEAGAAERAMVEADADLLARVDEFRRMRASLLSSSRRDLVDDDVIGAALAAFDEASDEEMIAAATADVAATPSPAPPPPPRLAPVRSINDARGRRAKTVYGWLGAAAAVGVLAVGINAVGSGSSSHDAGESAAASVAEVSMATEAPAAEAPAAAVEETIGAAAAEVESDTAMPAASEAAPAETEAPEIVQTEAAAETAAPASDETVAQPFSTETPPEISTDAELVDLGRLTVSSSDGVVSGGVDPVLAKATLISCPELGAEAIQEIVWKGKQAFILLKPTIVDPTEILAVSNNCEVLTTAPFSG